MLAFTYRENVFNLHISHIITDGGGVYPFLRTLLYYYLTEKYGENFSADGINLTDDEITSEETGNPYSEQEMKEVKPFYIPDKGKYFRLSDEKYAKEFSEKVFFIKVKQKDFIRVNKRNDGSPCILGAVLAAKAIWNVHPSIKDNIVCDVSCNLRSSMGNNKNYRLLSSSFPVIYSADIKDRDISSLCTYSRGMTFLNMQPENVWYYCEFINRLKMYNIGYKEEGFENNIALATQLP